MPCLSHRARSGSNTRYQDPRHTGLPKGRPKNALFGSLIEGAIRGISALLVHSLRPWGMNTKRRLFFPIISAVKGKYGTSIAFTWREGERNSKYHSVSLNESEVRRGD